MKNLQCSICGEHAGIYSLGFLTVYSHAESGHAAAIDIENELLPAMKAEETEHKNSGLRILRRFFERGFQGFMTRWFMKIEKVSESYCMFVTNEGGVCCEFSIFQMLDAKTKKVICSPCAQHAIFELKEGIHTIEIVNNDR